eukprot:TRINITY_DN13677_c0_g1_i1.p1 TRINITY_DN13677_c0_g1~~TRINITY_DN13677_c0_g1_i1.p1  ORF type:complete len:392 (+),score=55.88 TRINITY_DN13677_c0_g1_i1:195-1370(+)
MISRRLMVPLNGGNGAVGVPAGEEDEMTHARSLQNTTHCPATTSAPRRSCVIAILMVTVFLLAFYLFFFAEISFERCPASFRSSTLSESFAIAGAGDDLLKGNAYHHLPIHRMEVEHRCAWTPAGMPEGWTRKIKKQRREEWRNYALSQFIRLFDHLWRDHGIVTVLRSGSALGAFREGDRIAGDSDCDVYWIVPGGTTRSCLYSMVEAYIATLTPDSFDPPSREVWGDREAVVGGDARMYLTRYTALTNFAYRGYDPAVFWYEETVDGLTHHYGIDVDVVHESMVVGEDSFQESHNYNGVTARPLFKSLCRCSFHGHDTGVWCFDTPHIQRYLAEYYGSDFLIPQSKYNREIKFSNKRWFFTTWMGDLTWRLLDEDGLSFYFNRWAKHLF